MVTVTKSEADAGNILQEYADNRGMALRVDREKAIIHGVKVLGAVSAKGRQYPLAVRQAALPLYEGRVVNVDHIEPNQRRSYRDRIGCLRNNVCLEDGNYADLHYNPKHVLAEQLLWDAENAPQNVGFSHDARGPSKLKGGKVVVESIEKVLSVDLVANPATTSGLFEDSFVEGEIADKIDPREITVDWLKANRPDLLPALRESLTPSEAEKKAAADAANQIKTLQEELAALKAEEARRVLQETIEAELKAARLDPADTVACSEPFLAALRTTPDAAARKLLIEDRIAVRTKAPARNIGPVTSGAPRRPEPTRPPNRSPPGRRGCGAERLSPNPTHTRTKSPSFRSTNLWRTISVIARARSIPWSCCPTPRFRSTSATCFSRTR